MSKLFLKGAMLASALCFAMSVSAENNASQASAEAPAPKAPEKVTLTAPKISGYLQSGYNYGNKYGGDKSTFQMKRMRLMIDQNVGKHFSFRTQLECFSGSKDGGAYGKKVITIMDAFINAKINRAFNFRIGQYYLPFGFENYDISPATLELIDFSNICYRMICRNAISSPNLIDYGRDVGVMMYGDLLHNEDKNFDYLSYQLSLTNGYLPTLTDDNKSKDVVARITVRPIKNLRIIGSYNYGESAIGKTSKYNAMNRFQAGAWYFDPQGLTLRGEWGMLDSKDAKIKESAAYFLAGYKIGKFLPVVRWEMYRDANLKTSPINKDMVCAGLTYQPVDKVKFQANYTFTKYQKDVNMGGDGHGLVLMCLVHF